MNLYTKVYLLIPKIGSIKDEIKNPIINEDSVNECNVSFRDINMAIKKLNKRKGDGNHNFSSNHIILSTNNFKTIIVMLINCMLIHGHNPEDLLASVIASIPKNLWSSVNTSDNYMGIPLWFSLCKVIYYVFIDKYSKHLKSFNLQFAFQAEHDTVMCTSVVKETV